MGMNDAAQLHRIQEKVSFYQNCFWVCLAGMILFGCLTLFLCIYFHIPSIIMERLGIKRKRTLAQMNDPDIDSERSGTTIDTVSERTVLLTEDSFVMEKDIVLSEARNRQKKSEE